MEARNNLLAFAKEKGYEFSSLACTIIVVIYTPNGLLVTHVGDGRAGYCLEGEWKPLIVPHKGEEANQTIFLSSKIWAQDDSFIMSGVPVPESKVVEGKVAAFTLMSDGCEHHAFECSKIDPTTHRWSDPNLPSQ